MRVDQSIGPEERALVEVQMRRLGALELTVLDAAGIPVTGLDVELRSLELDADLPGWLAEGRIRATHGPSTDDRGRIYVEGLPRGPYAWSASTGGDPSSGTFELAARDEHDHRPAPGFSLIPSEGDVEAADVHVPLPVTRRTARFLREPVGPSG